jgi:hypothetical protein
MRSGSVSKGELGVIGDQSIGIRRREHLAEKVVLVDGLDGCGKTMLAPIVSALDRVELLSYAYAIEHLCSLRHLGKIDATAAAAEISMLVDLQLYNSMQSREINFRPSDLSSVFRDSQPLRYFRRLFQRGDEAAARRIISERPILLLTTHRMAAYCAPIFEALRERVVLIEVVRHPLYMLVQTALNFESIIGTARHFTVYYERDGRDFPYFVYGWEGHYLSENHVDRAIYYLGQMISRCNKMRAHLGHEHAGQIVTIPFERFVVRPDSYMREMEAALGTQQTDITRKMLKKQKVPRARYADSLDLAIYRRCGWEPPKEGFSERHEFEYRRNWAAERASPDAMRVLDTICNEYEEQFMDGSLRQGGAGYI